MNAPDLKLERTPCRGLIEAIAASLRARAEAKGVKLVVAESAEDIVARVDPRVLSQIVVGLANHAIARASRGEVRLGVARSDAGGRSVIQISVSGPEVGDVYVLQLPDR